MLCLMEGHLPLRASSFSIPKPIPTLISYLHTYNSECCVRRTVSSVDTGKGAGGLADEDRSVRVVLLHGGIGAEEEGPDRIN
jgi:hypothetical protein